MMQIEQRLWTKDGGWQERSAEKLGAVPQLVLVFGGRSLMEDEAVFKEIRSQYPGAYIVLSSTAGEILGDEVYDDSIAVTAVHFEKSVVRFAETYIEDVYDSLQVGKRLAQFLPVEQLKHAMVFSEGIEVNGTLLAQGINENLPVGVTVTGGLVGDGEAFKKTVVGRDSIGTSKKVVLLGFYGPSLEVGFGSYGGWEGLGERHRITRSEGNVLYEIDSRPALAVYKERLGDRLESLPSSALLHPLKLHSHSDKTHEDVVRTVLSVNEEDQSMTFAGDMPSGVEIEFMKADFEKLIGGASKAAHMSTDGAGSAKPALAILVSCIGRKLVLGDRVADEVKAVHAALGKDAALAGFYSYGELCPSSQEDKQCLLHNQTMTITTFNES